MSNQPAKVIIKVESAAEQQDHLKGSARKTLKVLQKAATDKENLVGRPVGKGIYKLKADSETELTELAKRKKLRTQATQTNPVLTADGPSAYKEQQELVIKDITGTEPPSEAYWQVLAEKRREALHETLEENQRLHERIDGLEEELETSRQMLDEARALVETLTEMLEETEAENAETAPIDKGPSTSLNSTGCSKRSLEMSTFDEEGSDED